MNRFSYHRAGTIEEAVKALSDQPAARIIAGGTNLVDLMKYNVEKPSTLIDVTRIDALKGINETEDGGLRIGALVPNSTVAYDERVNVRFPLLASAILAGATPQLRNAATTGGNLNQRTRCYYFYDVQTPCNKREPGSGCGAIGGLNRIHAILGASEHCIATHPSDMCVGLAALGAEVHIAGPAGERVIPFADYHRLPGDTPQHDNTLQPGEIVAAVVLPRGSQGYAGHYSYLKLRDRLSYAFALVSVAAALEIEGGVIASARIALGGVAHKPWRRQDAEDALAGKTADERAFSEAASLLLSGARGHEHNAFKIDLAQRAIVRALAQAAAGTPQSQTDKRIA
ncbi:FAD binding domain-containing protein [Bosea sp. PAMC 26642]|uniref:FAD binding domain-containing protein n=1 Tax=Bosea sp. (strain PAMC 26642) TaxID=1792307 RepID=UPI0007704D37|nr:xanthine dehydrogenase family protein subunit M [Bosea sp. PAMC 26642]AMJ62983.1 FAD-binding molybdopterin dehydrogenase [Bosea sp. PAMC 26642]